MDAERPRARLIPLILFATVVVAAAVASYSTNRGQPPVSTAPETAAAPEAASGPIAEVAPETPDRQMPGFDLVRVEPDGSAVVAGTAEPGADVTIFADSVPLAEVEADAEGNFVAVFRAEPTAAPRALTLGAVAPDGASAVSDDIVMLLPRAPAPPAADPGPPPGSGTRAAAVQPAAARPETTPHLPATEPASPSAEVPTPAPVALARDGDVAAAGQAAAEGRGLEPEVAATVIVRDGGVEISSADLEALGGRVALASISYAQAGDVTLAGVGTAGAAVRAYVDDRLAEEATVGGDGRWSMALDDVDVGLYTLRIDQLGADGRVASRVETPFQRDYPRAPPPRPGEVIALPGAGAVTVQPGHNLWTLARLHYGSGIMYSQIFTANRALIRDPDLIYPGQIFELPEVDRAE
jgi:nucleoid-associated protein YgaU